MTRNMGITDRSVRYLVGLALLALAAFKVVTGALMGAMLVVATIAILTAAVGVCPLYRPFGINTGAARLTRT